MMEFGTQAMVYLLLTKSGFLIGSIQFVYSLTGTGQSGVLNSLA